MPAAVMDPPQVNYLAIYHAYVDNFERFFCAQSAHTLLCDSVSRRRVAEWYNNQRPFIHLFVASEPPMLVFKEPQQDNILHADWNKTQMIRAYTYALVAYDHVCSVHRRPKLPAYTTGIQAGK
jgi:hypothetical protein